MGQILTHAMSRKPAQHEPWPANDVGAPRSLESGHQEPGGSARDRPPGTTQRVKHQHYRRAPRTGHTRKVVSLGKP